MPRMKIDTLTKQLNGQLGRLLKVNSVTCSQPKERMLQLDEVPVGAAFNHGSTNVLLCEDAKSGRWDVYVDEDLVYTGDNPKRQKVFQGIRSRGWRLLFVDTKLPPDINVVIVWVLQQLESKLRRLAPEALSCSFEALAGQFDDGLGAALDKRTCRLLHPHELVPSGLEPTLSQVDLNERAAETVLRGVAPNGPLLMGPAGVGKTTGARLAASELCRREIVQTVIEVRGSAICAGAVSQPERDERLRTILETYVDEPTTLLIVEQLDLALMRSAVAASLVAERLDQGLKMIAVASPQYNPRALRLGGQLQRRVEPCHLAPPDHGELTDILRQWMRRNRLAADLEMSVDVLPLVARLSSRRAGANPAAAVGLLAAVMNRAVFSGGRCVGPDDVFHLVN